MAKEILELCLDGDLGDKNVCKRVPVGVTESATFILDLEAVHHKDLTVDDNGFYGAHSSPTEHYQVSIDGRGKVSAMCRISKPDQKARVQSLPPMTTLLSEDSTVGQEVTRTFVV